MWHKFAPLSLLIYNARVYNYENDYYIYVFKYVFLGQSVL